MHSRIRQRRKSVCDGALGRCGRGPRMGTSILFVGRGDVAGDVHLELAMTNVVSPLDAEIYAVTDYREGPNPLCCYALERSFGTHLKTVGILDGSEAAADFLAESSGGTVRFERVPPPGRIRDVSRGELSSGAPAHVQWYRLQEAWRLMEAGERDRGSPYDAVIKLRFDYTPMQVMSPAILAKGSQVNAVHASSDFMFWGRRESMKFAAGIWQAMDDFFFDGGTHPTVMDRPIVVGSLLRSYAAQPREAMNQDTWRFYNKILTMPFVDMGRERSPAGVLDNLQAAKMIGLDFVDPQQGIAHPLISTGLVCHEGDYAPDKFSTEMDILTWFLTNNVTVCDLGSAVNSVLFKGQEQERPSFDCSMLPLDDVGQMVAMAKERWLGLLPQDFLDPIVGSGPVHATPRKLQRRRRRWRRKHRQRAANASSPRLWSQPDGRIWNLRGGRELQPMHTE